MKILDDLVRDLAHGARLLRKNRGFAVVAVGTLTVALGATVTVFSIVDAWLFRPLNFPEADRLVIAFAASRDRPSEPAVWLPYRAYLAWKERSHSFSSVSAAFFQGATITTADEARSAVGLRVTPDFFRTLGVPPLRGRTLTVSDVTGPPVVVLSYGFWQRHLGGANDVIGSSIRLSDVPHHVVGVMPREFDVRILDRSEGLEFWTPFRVSDPAYEPGGIGPVAIIGRLRPPLTIESARSEVAAVTQETERAYRVNFTDFVVNLSSLQDDNTRTVRSTLLTVSAAVLGLLLIAAVNVGTLMLGRGIRRSREAAIRAALGSGRARLIRQFLAESLLIALVGGIAGTALATMVTSLFIAWNPLGTLPANTIQLDLRVLSFAAAAMVLVTGVCGFVPALRVSLVADPNDALRGGGERASTTISSERAQTAMLVMQMAVSLVVLVAATLLTRTFVRLNAEPLGFNASSLWVASVGLPGDPFATPGDRNDYYRRLEERLLAQPGVSAVGASTAPPLNSGPPVTVNTGPADSTRAPRISAQDVTASFFRTLDVPLVAGRYFDDRDRSSGMPVVILNARAAQDLFGGPEAAVGQRIRLDAESWREIVGVVGNVRASFFNTLEWRTDPIVYRPAEQAFATVISPAASMFGFNLHIRSDRPLTLAAIREQARAISPRAAVTSLDRVPDLVTVATRQPALRMRLLAGFSIASLLLAAIGVYGVVSQAVASRLREIAIRIALGAAPSRVVSRMTRGMLFTGAAGVAVGVCAALLLGDTLEALLYGVRSRDVPSFVVSGAALLVVTAAAALIPAFRAVRTDPAKVLRAE